MVRFFLNLFNLVQNVLESYFGVEIKLGLFYANNAYLYSRSNYVSA